MQHTPFHLAFPIRDIEETRRFYGELLGCEIGRSTDKWIDFNFFGHQLSAHVKPEELAAAQTNAADGKNVSERRFDAILKWINFNFFGHQLSATHTNAVDGKNVPVRHFGAILEWDQWHALADKLRAEDIEFVIEPYIRFKGEVGEQATMFFLDPSGNALEFKSFQNPDQIFAS